MAFYAALAASSNKTVIQVLEPECGSQAGCVRNYSDNRAPTNSSVFYRVQANNTVGGGNNRLETGTALPALVNGNATSLTPNFLGYDNVTASSAMSSSGANGIGSRILPVSPTALAFGNVQLGLILSPERTVTVTNTQATTWMVSNVQICSNNSNSTTCNTNSTSAMYTMRNDCGAAGSLAQNGSCSITVTFAPTSTGAKSAYLKLTTVRTGSTTRRTCR